MSECHIILTFFFNISFGTKCDGGNLNFDI
jgi:hypothetical protein